ncbi:MAG: hypothetical protein JWP25_8275 [Bradyrhizobium sp.]|nr:hypothetical protein [Bradyrhizobium sp.]
MTKAKDVKNEFAGTTKRLAGEILGDQKLHDQGKTQEQQGDKENEEAGKLKPLGNLDQLT